ncbi:MAG: mandelate racemase/muconate lactonizing enzyme family protein [Planctomycetota bacterium]|nr:mandelate racemase/muconate lactonizing enzyme family protein [Planctomycetota bacterium]
MNIKQIETFLLEAKLSGGESFYSSQGRFADRRSLLVKITTDDGLIGWGESGVSMPLEHVQTFIHDSLAPRLLGKSASDTEPIWHDLYSFSRDFGRKATPIDAMSGIDIALWDIRGKEAGKPIHLLMGGAFRSTTRAYATGLYYHEEDLTDPDSALNRVKEEVIKHREAGFSAIKGKIGLLAVHDDVRRMAAAREAVGDEFLLMTDANHGYNRHTARTVGWALYDLGFYWFEEPLVPEDIEGLASLRQELHIPIAAGECEYTRYGMLDLLRRQAVDFLQPDISACGGLSEGQKIVALASAHQTPVCLHVWGSGVAVAAALQLNAAIPPMPHTANPSAPDNEPLFEFDRSRNPLRDDLIAGGFTLEDDQVHIPQGPGLGVEIDQDALGHFCVASRLS